MSSYEERLLLQYMKIKIKSLCYEVADQPCGAQAWTMPSGQEVLQLESPDPLATFYRRLLDLAGSSMPRTRALGSEHQVDSCNGVINSSSQCLRQLIQISHYVLNEKQADIIYRRLDDVLDRLKQQREGEKNNVCWCVDVYVTAELTAWKPNIGGPTLNARKLECDAGPCIASATRVLDSDLELPGFPTMNKGILSSTQITIMKKFSFNASFRAIVLPIGTPLSRRIYSINPFLVIKLERHIRPSESIKYLFKVRILLQTIQHGRIPKDSIMKTGHSINIQCLLQYKR
ncbi:hypothetical protein INR49_025351 [Caranx melampygus]|nr:hypothetical protein INR49_025351 [Caranx melampygus]